MIGQIARQQESAFLAISDNGISTSFRSSRDILKHKVNRADVERWKDEGFFDRVVKCLNTRDSRSSSIDSRIWRAITWRSKGINADNYDEQFVALAVALEILLVGSGQGTDPKVAWGSITQKLADRVAFLLGQNYEERSELSKKVKLLYRLRSKIVHEGAPVSSENLVLLDRIAVRIIFAFISHDFASMEEFEKWIECQKYTVSTPVSRR